MLDKLKKRGPEQILHRQEEDAGDEQPPSQDEEVLQQQKHDALLIDLAAVLQAEKDRLVKRIFDHQRKVAAAEASGGKKPKLARFRLTEPQMAIRLDEDVRFGIKSLYARCTGECKQVYTIIGGHNGCKIGNAMDGTEEEKKEEEKHDAEFKTVYDKKTRCIKQSIGSALHEESAEFVLETLRGLVTNQHRLRYVLGPGVNSYIIDKCLDNNVSLDNIHMAMPNVQTGEFEGDAEEIGKHITLGKDRFQTAMAACTQKNNGTDAHAKRVKLEADIAQAIEDGKPLTDKQKIKPDNDPIQTYIRDVFLDNMPRLRATLGSHEHIAGGSLSDLAVRCKTNHEQMMATLIWKRVKYLVRCKLETIVARIPLFASKRPALMEPIRSWLAQFATCDGYLDWMINRTDEQIREHFLEFITRRVRNKARWLSNMAPWHALWNALWDDCLSRIVRVLMPLKQASKQKEIAESVGKKRLFRKKTMDPTIVAAYRCAWIFAINRHLGDAETAAVEAAAAAGKPATPSTLK
jgi:hypothetical protein